MSPTIASIKGIIRLLFDYNVDSHCNEGPSFQFYCKDGLRIQERVESVRDRCTLSNRMVRPPNRVGFRSWGAPNMEKSKVLSGQEYTFQWGM